MRRKLPVRIRQARTSLRLKVAVTSAISVLCCKSAVASTLDGTVTFIPISTNAYGVNDLNSVGISRDNLATVGNYQYTAYYQYVNSSTGTIVVGRRAVNSTSWTLASTPYSINIANNGSDSIITNAIDDHDVVAMAVDGNGDMHLSWGMHNIPLNYAISTPVNGATFNPTFTKQTPSNDPNLFAEFTATGISQATYPEFYYTPDSAGAPSGNLLFSIRDASSATGGGSGNGDSYLSVFNTSGGYSAPVEELNGGLTSVNGYQNNLVYDHNNQLLMSWTWRSTANWQTNSNILFAQSSTNGTSWTQQGGTPSYTLPIIANTASGGSASQVAQAIESIGQNSSLINQAGMTVDANNNPIIATWWTPNGNASQGVSATNNPNRQYMLVYYTGSQWKTSQITNRTVDNAFDTSGTQVRDLGRPLVMVDNQGRVLVITRSDNAMGSFTNSGGSGNNIIVYWNTISSLDSPSPAPWEPITLDSSNMGEWEPSMDYNLWKSSNLLDLFYEPSGFTGQTTASAQVLQWNEPAYFAVATPASLVWSVGAPGAKDGAGIWDYSHTNWTAVGSSYAWNNSYSTYATFGSGNGAAGVVTLGANITAQTITFNPAGSGNYNITGGGFTLVMPAGAIITANADALISAPISFAGGLNKLGRGQLTLSGNNSFAGNITLGSAALTGGNVSGTLQITGSGAVKGATQVIFTDSAAAFGVFQLNGSGGTIALPATLGFSMAGSASIANANVIESVAGNNSIDGTISPAIGGNQYTVQSDAGTLTVNSNFNLGSLGTSRYLNLTGQGTGNWVGVLGNGTGGGTLGVTKLGNGTWSLNANNTFTGLTNVSAGTLVIGTAGSIASTAVTIANGATLNAFGTMNANTSASVNGLLTLQAFTSAGLHSRTFASLNISGTGSVATTNSADSSNRTVLIANSLSFAGNVNAWSGKLDLADNDLVVHNGSLQTLNSQVAAGFANGGWNAAAGITSQTASVDSTHLTALGVIQNSVNGSPIGSALYNTFDSIPATAADVLVKYTYFGDANLDGRVDGSDYSRIDSGFLSELTGWANGDFNYDGVINGSDYTLIDNSFNTQGSALSAQLARATVQIAGSGANSAVPEPAALGFAITIALGLLGRRR